MPLRKLYFEQCASEVRAGASDPSLGLESPLRHFPSRPQGESTSLKDIFVFISKSTVNIKLSAVHTVIYTVLGTEKVYSWAPN